MSQSESPWGQPTREQIRGIDRYGINSWSDKDREEAYYERKAEERAEHGR